MFQIMGRNLRLGHSCLIVLGVTANVVESGESFRIQGADEVMTVSRKLLNERVIYKSR